MMQDRHSINSDYYCGRLWPDGSVITIFTTSSYQVGEFDERTGEVRWLRLVLAAQKVGIQRFLQQQFPLKQEAVLG